MSIFSHATVATPAIIADASLDTLFFELVTYDRIIYVICAAAISYILGVMLGICTMYVLSLYSRRRQWRERMEVERPPGNVNHEAQESLGYVIVPVTRTTKDKRRRRKCMSDCKASIHGFR